MLERHVQSRVHIAQCLTSTQKDQTTAERFQVIDTANRRSGPVQVASFPGLPPPFFFAFWFAFSIMHGNRKAAKNGYPAVCLHCLGLVKLSVLLTIS